MIHYIKRQTDAWLWLVTLLTLVMVASLLFLVVTAFSVRQETIEAWISSGILWEYFWRTILLMVGSGLIAGFLGSFAAWCMTFYQFPFKRILDLLIFLPFIIPPWISAWSWKEMLDYAGPYHNMLKYLAASGIPIDPNAWLIRIDNLWGAIFILSFTHFPYVYLLCKIAFKRQSANLTEAAYSLGYSGFRFFYYVSIPLIRPALAAGILLVMMESLSDYGTVKYFSVPTLSLAVEDAWIYRADYGAASIISVVILVLALAMIFFEQLFRRKMRSFAQNEDKRAIVAVRLSWRKSLSVIALLCLPIIIGLVVPLTVIIKAAIYRLKDQYDASKLLAASLNSVSLSLITTIIALLFAIILVWAVKNSTVKSTRYVARVATVTYGIPGMVLAAAILIFASMLDHIFGKFGIILVGSITLLIYAWIVRFFAMAVGNMDAGFSQIRPAMVNSARILGVSWYYSLYKIYFPLLKGFIVTAGVMIFVECMKELTLALMIRPFGMELLSLYVWQYGSLEQLEEAAPGALILICISFLSIIILWSNQKRKI